MLSALSTVPPPTLFVNLLFLKVSTCRWVCFLVLLHLGETRDNYSTLMPLHILSFGWAFSPRLSLSCTPWTFDYASITLVSIGSCRFRPLFIYVYISMGRVLSFWGLDGFTHGSHLPFSKPLSLPARLALTLSSILLLLSLWYNTFPRYSLSRV